MTTPHPSITSGDRILTPVLATAESLKGYGWLIGQPTGPEREKIDFYGREVRVTHPAAFKGIDSAPIRESSGKMKLSGPIDSSGGDLCLNLVSFKTRPLEVRWMEYHTKHTQTFIPLSGQPL